MLVTTDEVDEIRKEKGERELRLLLIVERSEWHLPKALWLFQEKLNAYASFILDGKMRSLYPWADPKDVRIVVQSHGQAPQVALEAIEKANAVLAADGPVISFEQVE